MTTTARTGAMRALLFATSALVTLAASGAQAGPLPTGGAVTSGTAGIASTATQVTVTQSSAKAIVTWSDFSIGQGNTVQFNNGTGSTLNRVTGANASAIDGALNATGSVYLINQNGVVIGKTGVVNVGGSFVASTLDIPDASWLAGGSLTFSGSSTASVVNLGQIGASGGDVALIAQTVENDGTITAASGDVGLLAGSQVSLSDTLSSNGRFQVTLGSGSSSTNAGTIQAAITELRAYGGNVYALAGNTGASITATGVSTNDGQVFLTANAPGGATGVGDITISGGVSFSGGANALTIDAFHNASILTPISTTGGHVTLITNDGGVGGDYGFGLGPTGFAGSLSFLGGAGSGESLTINGQAYTLLYALSLPGSTGPDNGLDDIAGINNNSAAGGLNGHYALATSVTQPNGQVFTGALVVSDFNGVFEGLGNTISNLTITDATIGDRAGLFWTVGFAAGATIRDMGLIGGAVALTGTGVTQVDGYVGGIVGGNNGLVANVWTSGAVTGAAGDSVGGVVGINYAGTIDNTFATGAVSGGGAAEVGGLAGANHSGVIIDAYATGPVNGGAASSVGGLVGDNGSDTTGGNGTITDSYAAGPVSGGAGSLLGGLAGGANGSITDGYYDADTTGQPLGTQANGSVGLTNTQMLHAASFAGFNFSSTGPWGIVEGQSFPYLVTFGAPGGTIQPPAQTISGDVYSTFGGSALGGATVEEVQLSGGSVISSGTSAAGTGAYNVNAPSSNGTLLLFLSGGGTLADTIISYNGSSRTGVNLYGGYLNFPNASASTLSATLSVLSSFNTPAGGFSSSDFLFTGTTPTAGIAVNSASTAGFTVDETLALTGSNGLAITTTAGSITLAKPVSLASGALGLNSSDAIVIDAPVIVSGPGAVSLNYNPISPTNLSFALGDSISYGSTDNGGMLTINSQPYTLLYALSLPGSTGPDNGTSDIAGIQNNSAAGGLNGHYALATSVTQPSNQVFTGPLVVSYFNGVFEGLGNTISNLTITDPTDGDRAGLFWTVGFGAGATIRDLGLIGGVVTLTGSGVPSSDGYVGGIVGGNNGLVANVWTSGTVIGAAGDSVGGVVGINYAGTIDNTFATGAVSGGAGAEVGGLVGANHFATIKDSYATGPVSGGAASSTGGLVGDNTGSSISDAYATGSVSGGSGSLLGGLTGGGGSINDGYYDADTTGQSLGTQANGSVGLTNTQMLHAANFTSFDFSATGPWRIVEGHSFPYLAWQFSGTPGVVSGTVSSSLGGSPVGAATISGYANGTALAFASSGANGYYQILTVPGLLTNADVVTFLPGAAPSATALATGVTGAVTGLDLEEGALFIQTGAPDLLQLPAHYANALGGFTSPDLIWTPGTTLAAGLPAGSSLVIKASGNFLLDQGLNLGSGTMEVDAGGIVSEFPHVIIQTADLTGSSVGGASFTTSDNRINGFSWSNSGGGGITLDDFSPLTLNGVAAGTGDLTVGGPQSWRIHDTGALTAGGAISLSASHGIDISGQVTAGGAVTLTGSSVGGVAEYGAGAISAASLGGSATMAVLNGGNAVGAITGFTTTAGFLFNDTQALTVTGPITGGSGLLYLTSGGALTINGSLTSTGNMLLRANGDIAIDAGLNTSGNLVVNATGAVSETGSITANALLGYSNGSTNLSGANTINTLAGYQVYHGGATLTLADQVHLTVTAPVAAYGVHFTDLAGLSITGPGSVTAHGGGRTLNGVAF